MFSVRSEQWLYEAEVKEMLEAVFSVEVEIKLRPTVSRCQAPIWDPQPIFISPLNFL
jgi:hypothetical protein